MEATIDNRYKIIEKLKTKSQNQMFRGFDLKDKREVAIKVIDLKNTNETRLNKIKKEIDTMNKIDSKYSLKCYESFNTISEMYIILEYCQDNLFDKMKSFRNTAKVYYLKKIFNQLMEVYKTLHENHIIIRELKPEKVLIKYTNEDETDFDIKISDYSYSKELSDEDITKTIIGYSAYVAPEITKGEEYTNKCDLWSIGILAYVLYFGKVPQFKSKNNFQSIISIEEDYNLEDLLQKLLVPDPTKRISWEEFFEHNFFKQKIFGDVTKKDFEEVCQKYPKLQNNLGGLEIEEYYDKELNMYGEVIKGTKILHGRGIYISKSLGVLVKGYFFDGKQNGKSEMIFSDGGNFEGEFLNGVKFGKGKEVYPNGNEYEGDYKNGLFDGFGIFKYNNGNYYEGEFKCDSRHGKGTFYNKSLGQKYVCNWANDLKHGNGTVYFDNGKKIEGNWKNGIRDGEFKLYKNKDVNEFKVELYQNGAKKATK